MEKLISGRCHLQLVPETYILPPESRPGQTQVPQCETIPVLETYILPPESRPGLTQVPLCETIPVNSGA